MSGSAVVPLWLAAGTPLLAFLGVITGMWVTRKGAAELETRSRREETMRTLTWAAELAVSSDRARAELGLRELHALEDSAMLDPEQRTFIDAALMSVYGDAEAQIEAAEDSGEMIEVVLADVSDAATTACEVGDPPDEGPAPLPSADMTSASPDENTCQGEGHG